VGECFWSSLHREGKGDRKDVWDGCHAKKSEKTASMAGKPFQKEKKNGGAIEWKPSLKY
jgi:hypothetical protein